MALLERGSVNLARTLSSLRHRNFRLLFFGTSLSHVGDFVQAMAQSWLVWTMTNSPLPARRRRLLPGAAATTFGRRRRRHRRPGRAPPPAAVRRKFWRCSKHSFSGSWCNSMRSNSGMCMVLVLFLGTVNTINQTARHSLINNLVPRDGSDERHRAQFFAWRISPRSSAHLWAAC